MRISLAVTCWRCAYPLFQLRTHCWSVQVWRASADSLSALPGLDGLPTFVVFHECFVNAVCLDLITAVCTALRRHLGRVHCMSKTKNLLLHQLDKQRKLPKAFTLSSYTLLLRQTVLKPSCQVEHAVVKHGCATVQSSLPLCKNVLKVHVRCSRFRVHCTRAHFQMFLQTYCLCMVRCAVCDFLQ